MPIGAERHTVDDSDEPSERPYQSVALKVPQLNRPVFGGGGEGPPVGTECDATDRSGVTLQRRSGYGRERARKRRRTVSSRNVGGNEHSYRSYYQRSFAANDHLLQLTPSTRATMLIPRLQ